MSDASDIAQFSPAMGSIAHFLNRTFGCQLDILRTTFSIRKPQLVRKFKVNNYSTDPIANRLSLSNRRAIQLHVRNDFQEMDKSNVAILHRLKPRVKGLLKKNAINTKKTNLSYRV